jgi:signal transduction histidine kinase
MARQTGSLNGRFAAGTAAGLLVSSLCFLVLFVSLYRGQLEQERSAASSQVSRLVQASVADLVRGGATDRLPERLERLAAEPTILNIRLLGPAGEVLLESGAAGDGAVRAPVIAGDVLSRAEDEDGRAILRSRMPLPGARLPTVRDGADCRAECDETPPVSAVPGEQTAGITLELDFDTSSVDRRTLLTTLLLMGAGALIVVINLAGGWWFVRRHVVGPVTRLSEASQRLAAGDLETRISLPGRDEFSLLAQSFNAMADSLRAKVHDLEDRKRDLQALVDAIPDGVRVIDADFRVVLVNATYRRQHGFGPEDPLPEHCYAASHGRSSPCPETLTLCTLKAVGTSGEPVRVVHRHVRADGEPLDVEVYAAPTQLLGNGGRRRLLVESIRDLEQQVRFSHEQRLSELGRLAAGVAHEIHNPLMALRMALHAAEAQLRGPAPDTAAVREHLSLAEQEIGACEGVTERLLKLSMPPASEPELVVVEPLVADTLKLLAWEAEKLGVAIVLSVEGAPLRVVAGDSDLRMATLNLAQNACHAMPGGGKLVVSCERTDGRIRISFEDTGVGIEPGERQRIFEPFFSRRADGVRGTGLGLSITKAIVEGHGGRIDVTARRGGGSRFVIELPDADAPDRDAAVPDPGARRGPQSASAPGR